MKAKCLRFLMLGAILMSLHTQAALVEWDAFAEDDGLAVKDIQSGLVWLDLSLTAGLSYNDAATQFDGWQVADAKQVGQLFSHAFSDFTDNSGQGAYNGCLVGQLCYAEAQHYASVFGYTPHILAPSFHYSFGLFESSDSSLQMMGTVVQTGLRNANIYSQLYNVDYSGFYHTGLYNLSVYLVKIPELIKPLAVDPNPTHVNEPGSLMSLGTLCVLFMWRKRKQI